MLRPAGVILTMSTIKIKFVDFWKGYSPLECPLYKTIQELTDVVLVETNPDILIYSCFGDSHKKYNNCIKVFYTAENRAPDFKECDYSISFMRDSAGGKNLYLPLGLLTDYALLRPLTDKELLNRKFCNFLYSQDGWGEGAKFRKTVCAKLGAYKFVDCAGRVLNNVKEPSLSKRYDWDWHTSKINYLRKFKFTIAIENTNAEGYITEKLTDPLFAQSVPIYWGSNGDLDPLSRDGIVCVYDMSTWRELLDHIIELDNNPKLYLEMCHQNPVLNSTFHDYKDLLRPFLQNFISKL